MAGIRAKNMIYDVGNYCRLSKDDGTDNESASIATQKSILTDYVKKQGWNLVKTYVDDGYSGTNFQRPAFQEMLKDIENGLINCVITKDLSRLGRNYLDCGLYLEVFFPEHNVRYIAVNDGVDTLNKSAMDITPFRNILNEMYSADVSVKIKSAYRARFQQGKFMGTTAPYGYVKDPADHNHLLIDDKVAHVVREIFDLALAGNGIAKIRKHINKQHILRPAAYAVEQGATGYERYFEGNEENRYIWSENSIRGILRSPIYAGNLAGYKRIAANMKSKKRPSKLPEEWEVIPDTHEGIVTQEEFDTVQQLMTSRRREQNAGGFENIFSGVIKCADCGYAMRAASANRRKRPDIIDCVQYTCNNYGRYGNVMCTAHSIEARDLFNAVLADINRFADMAVNDEKAVRAIEKRLTETDQSKAKALEKEQRKLNKRLAELDRLFSSLYEDKVMERITERNFEMMSGKYQKEQLEIEARVKEVTETLNDSYEKSQGVHDFLSLIRNYQGIKELDATIINALIDKILVSEREKLTDGTVRQEIKIYYKFIGFVGELHITPTKRWTALKPKNCMVCGVEYVPGSGISKYCPTCAKRIQREKSNESKRRSRERNRQACIELSAKNDRLMKDGVPDGYWKWADSVTEESRKRLGYGFTSSSNAIVFFDDTGKATFDLTSMFKGATDENFIPGRYDFFLKIPYKDGSQTKYAYSNRCSVTIEKRVTGADIIADGINVTKGGGTTTEDIPTYTMPGNTNVAELSAQPLMENATIPELKANWYIVSGEDIASVSSYGQLKAKKPGVVTVAMNVSGYEELNRVRVPANYTRYINIIIPIAGFKAGNVDLAAEVKNGTVYNDLKIPITHVRCYGGDWIENTENQYLTADCRYADGRTYSYNTASGYINMQDPVAYNDKVKVQFLIKPQEGYQFPLYVTYDGGSGYRESMANSSIIECNIPGNGTISPAAMLSGYEEFGKYADDTTGWTVSTPGLTYMLEQDCIKNPQSVYIDTVFINTVEPQEGDLRYAGEIPSGATGEKLAQNPDMMNVKTLTLSNIKTSKGENVITTRSKVSKITVKSGTGEAYKPVHYDDSSTSYENGNNWHDVLMDRSSTSSTWYSKEQIESKVYESATYMHELDIYGDIGADGTEYFFAPDVKLIVNGRNVQLLNPTYNYNGTYSEENGNQYIGYDATHLSATYYVVTDTSPAYSYAQVVIPAPVSGAKPATEDDVSISGVKYTGSDALVSNHGIYASRLTWFIDTNTNGVPDEGEYGEGIFDTDGSFKGNTVYSAYVELKVREGKGRIDGNNFIMKIFGPPSPATIAKQKGSCIYEKTGRPMVTFDYNTEFVLPATTDIYAFPFKDVPNYETHHMTSSSYGYKDSTGNSVNEFVPGKKYTCAMTFAVDDEYRIKDDISFTIDGVKYTIGNGLTLDEQGPTRTYIVFNYSFIYPGGAGASVFGNIESFNSASDTVTIQLIADGQTDPSYETTASGGTQNDNKFTAEYSFTNVASGSYTMRVIKKNHVTREYALTVGADSVEKNVKIHLLGDVDGDGNVSTIDWSLVRDHINETNTLTGYEFDCANVDKDEYITSIDCVRIQDHINESVPLW